MNTKVIAIANEDSDKTRILGYGADLFSTKPMSPENVADKVLMLLSREAVIDIMLLSREAVIDNRHDF